MVVMVVAQEQRFAEAAQEYVEAASYLEYITEEEEEDNGDTGDAMDEGKGGGGSVAEEAKALEVTLQANAALCYLKAEMLTEAAQHATAALKKEPVRVVFRGMCVFVCVEGCRFGVS